MFGTKSSMSEPSQSKFFATEYFLTTNYVMCVCGFFDINEESSH